MMCRVAAVWWTLLHASSVGAAVPAELLQRVATERAASCAEYRILFFSLYRAELWTDADTLPGERFGLTLRYHRSFSREELVSVSLAEMARMSGEPATVFDSTRIQLEQGMRSVSKGDHYTAWREGPNQVELYHNGVAVGTLTHHADLFLDIWLGPKTRKPTQRMQLLSGRCDD